MANVVSALFGGKPPIQDYVILGGKRSPGAVSIVKAGSPRKWDIRQGYAFSGASVYYIGDQPSKFDLIFTLWEDDHWSDWDDFASVLERPPKGTRPKAVGIQHPILSVRPLSISSVVIEDVSQPILSEWGDWDIVVNCLEFRAPLPILGKVNQAIPALAKPLPTAQDAADVTIGKLLDAFNGLAGQ